MKTALASVLALSLSLAAPARAQLVASQAQESALAEVVMVSVNRDCAAGIIVGYDAEFLYVATAAHVATRSAAPPFPAATVRFQGAKTLARAGAFSSRYFDPPDKADLAVIAVPEDAELRGFQARLNFALLSPLPSVPNNVPVRTVGCSGGAWWTLGTKETLGSADKGYLRVNTDTGRGQSGGGLYNDAWELIGMPFLADGNTLTAHPIGDVIQELLAWKVPVQLAQRPVKDRVRGSDELARQARAITFATLAQSSLKGPSPGAVGDEVAAYAIAAVRQNAPPDSGWFDATWNALQRVVFQRRVQSYGPIPDPFGGVRVSFATARADGGVSIGRDFAALWDADGTRERQRLEHGSSVTAMALSPDGKAVATIGKDRAVRLWSVESGSPLGRYAYPSDVVALAFSSDSQWLVAGNADGLLRTWKRSEAAPRRIVRAAPDAQLLAACDEARVVAEADEKGNVHVITTSDGREVATVSVGTDLVGLSLDPGCRRMTTAQMNGSARIFAAATGREIARIPYAGQSPERVALSPDGRSLAIVPHLEREYEPFVVRVISLVEGRDTVLNTYFDGFDGVQFTADSRGLAVFSYQPAGNGTTTTVELNELDLSGREEALIVSDARLSGLAFDASAQHVLVASSTGNLRLLARPAGVDVSIDGGMVLEKADLSPDGAMVAGVDGNHLVHVWLANGSSTPTRLQLTSAVAALKFRADGKVLLIASTDGELWTLDVGAGTSRRVSIEDCCALAAFSADGRWLVFVNDGQGSLVEVATGNILKKFTWRTYEPDFNEPTALTVASDGARVAIGQQEDDTIVLAIPGDTAPASIAVALPEAAEIDRMPIQGPAAVQFSADGQFVVAGSSEGLVMVHRANGSKVAQINADISVTHLAVSDTGLVAVADERGQIRLWNTPIEAMLRQLCASRGVNLTKEEWMRNDALAAVPWFPVCENWPR